MFRLLIFSLLVSLGISSCGSDGEVEDIIEFDIISPIQGKVYGTDESFKVNVNVSSNVPMSNYTFEIINYRWPGFYHSETGNLSGTSGTIIGKTWHKLADNATTRKSYSLKVTIFTKKGTEVIKEIGFGSQGN